MNADFALRCNYTQVTCSPSWFTSLKPSKNTCLKLEGLFSSGRKSASFQLGLLVNFKGAGGAGGHRTETLTAKGH